MSLNCPLYQNRIDEYVFVIIYLNELNVHQTFTSNVFKLISNFSTIKINKIFHTPTNTGDQKYSIDFNPPTLKQISFPQIIMVAFTLVPKLSFEFANFKDSTFKWFVEKEIKNNENKSTNAKKFKVNQTTSGDRLREQDWLMISEEFTFTPSDEHNNLFIKFSCLPKNNDRVGEEVSFISKCRVIDGPKNCPFEKRHKFTQLLCGKDRFVVD